MISSQSILRMALVITALIFFACPAFGNETYTCELKKTDIYSLAEAAPKSSPDYFDFLSPQSQIIAGGRLGGSAGILNFSSSQKKVRETDPTDSPVRGEFMLGEQEFPFMFESSGSDSEGYDRLHFDWNGNGELSDETVLKANKEISSSRGLFSLNSITSRRFGPRNVTLRLEGEPAEYGVFLTVSKYGALGGSGWVNVALHSACCCVGEVVLDGKSRKFFIFDRNSNGRFDDCFEVDYQAGNGSESLVKSPGDLLFLDPDKEGGKLGGYSLTRREGLHPVSRLLCVDGKFYEMDLSPSGDRLRLTPLSEPMGFVANPNENFHALVYSDRGVVKIDGGEEGVHPLPEGDWRLIEYTIDRTDPEKRGRPTFVTAAGTLESPKVEVREGKTAYFPFGPPYKPVVSKTRVFTSKDLFSSSRKASLSFNMQGTGGEILSEMTINGASPREPRLTIRNKKGEVIEKGRFRYG